MSIRFHCPRCGHRLKAGDEDQGRRVACTRCRQPMLVPRATDAEPIELDSSVGETPPPGDAAFAADDENDVDMTPMIDVVFQLLIFFMITATFGVHKALDLPSPETASTAASTASIEELEQDPGVVVVRVEADNSIWVGSEPAPSEQELFAQLRRAMRGDDSPAGRGANTMLVLAHENARHDRVVVALSAAAEVGMLDVRLGTVEGDEF